MKNNTYETNSTKILKIFKNVRDSVKKLSDITEIKNVIISYFDNHQNKKLVRTFNKLFQDPQFSFEQKLDILGDLTVKDSEYFMDKIYPSIQSLYKKWSLPELIKMDEYMLKNYCFLEGEDTITTFYGSIVDKKTTTSGRIYLTNFRILACGPQVQKSAGRGTSRPTGLLTGAIAGISAGISAARNAYRKAIRKGIAKTLRKDIEEWNIGEWGYYFPIYNAKKIKRSKKSVSYTIDVETEKKTISLRITISPKRMKKQPNPEFQEQKKYGLNQVEELLKQYQ